MNRSSHISHVLVVPMLLVSGLAAAADCVNGLNASGFCTLPAGVTEVTVRTIGGGGGGGYVAAGSGAGGGGGGGGAICSDTWSVVPGDTVVAAPGRAGKGQTATVAGSAAGDTVAFLSRDANIRVEASAGHSGLGSAAGAGGSALCQGQGKAGGNGASGLGSEAGGGGGGAAGSLESGRDGTHAGTVTTGGAGGAGIPSGGQGGNGGTRRRPNEDSIPSIGSGLPASFPGGGGGGTAGALAGDVGGDGAAGAVYLYWPVVRCGGVATVSNALELYAAIAGFNSLPGNCIATISFANDIALTNLGFHDVNFGPGPIPVPNSLPTIWNPHPGAQLHIQGNGYRLDNAGGQYRRLLHVYADTSVSIDGLTITGGDMSGGGLANRGGGILNEGYLSLTRVTVAGNKVGTFGAGIANRGTLDIEQSTISGNLKTSLTGASPTIAGGGIHSEGNDANVTIVNSTLSGNASEAIWQNGGKLTLDSATVTDNDKGLEAFGLVPLEVRLTNSLLSANGTGLPDDDCDFQNLGGSRVLVDGGHNLVGSSQNTCGVVNDVNGNITSQAAKLGPLADNGGPTKTHAPLVGSPVLDAGATTRTKDQRGQPRPIGPAADIGAFESTKCTGLTEFPVTTEREWQDAIACFNAQTAPGVYTIRLTQGWGQPDSSPVIANATAGVSLVIEGQHKIVEGFHEGTVRLVEIAAGTEVTINDVRLQVGYAPAGDGGAILNRGKLKLAGVTVFQSIAKRGGAVFNDTSGDVTIEDSTFDRNGSLGGATLSENAAVFNAGHMVIRNSTFSGNNATLAPAIWNENGAAFEMDSVTVTLNRSDLSVNAVALSGTALALNNNIIAGNTGGAGNVPADFSAPCAGLAGSHNLVFSQSAPGCFADGVNGNIVGHDANLGPLRSNGGLTQTHDLLPSSPAIDAGATALTSDQRGQARPVGAAKDMGAVETLGAQKGLLTIVRATDDPLSGTGFDYTLAGGSLGAPIGFTLTQNSGSEQFVLDAGVYTVTEDLLGGPSDSVVVTCVDANIGISGATLGNVLTVQLDVKDDIVCTFYNKSWFAVHASASGLGTVSCTPEVVVRGGTSTCTAVPQSGFMVQNWTDDCVAAGQDTQCYLSKITSDQDSTVVFTGIPLGTFTVTAKVKSGKGSVTCDPALVTSGGASTCTATPNPGYQFDGWEGDCASWGSDPECLITKIKSNKSSLANFSAIPPPQTFAVTATADNSAGGFVSCSPASVTAGGNAACTATPIAGFQVSGWSGACSGAGTSTSCSLTNIQSDQDSIVYFSPIDFTVSANVVGGNGSVVCAPSPVAYGGSSLCTAVPDAGFQVSGWTGACAATGTNVQCSLVDIQSAQTSTVSFSAIPPSTFTVTAKVSGSGGAVSCVPTSVAAGGSATCTAKPKSGYRVSGWSGSCAHAGSDTSCILANIQANQGSTVSFSLIVYAISASVVGGNGTVSCSPATATIGGGGTCTAVPDTGFQVSAWTGACAAAGTNVQCSLIDIDSDQTSTVSFSSIPPSSFTVTAKVSGSGGGASCSPTLVSAGDDAVCTAKPKPGYQVAAWTGACASAGAGTDCSLTNIQSNQSATVSFSLISYVVGASVVGGNGTVSCTPASVTYGSSSACTAVANAGFAVSGWTGACALAGTATTCVLDDIQSDLSSTVSFSATAPQASARPVPSLSAWGLLILGLLLLAAGGYRRADFG